MILNKNIYLLFISILFFVTTKAQISSPPAEPTPDSVDSKKIFVKVEVDANYPGGDKAWLNYLVKNLNGDVGRDNGAPPGDYTVIIEFVVDKDGTLIRIKPLTNHGYGMEEEVIRLLKISPKWRPAIIEGKPVKAFRKQPVTFQVIENKKSKRKNRS